MILKRSGFMLRSIKDTQILADEKSKAAHAFAPSHAPLSTEREEWCGSFD